MKYEMPFREQMPDTAVSRILKGVTLVEKRSESTRRVPLGGIGRRQYLEHDVNSMILLSAQTLWRGGNVGRGAVAHLQKLLTQGSLLYSVTSATRSRRRRWGAS